jgi:hypothetical protein
MFLAPVKFLLQFFSHDTKTSKVSEKDKQHDFYPKNFIMNFYSILSLRDTGSMLKRNLEKIRINHQKLYQEPDQPTTFMKIVSYIAMNKHSVTFYSVYIL